MDVIPITGFSEPFSSLSHLIAAGIAAVGGFVLWYKGRGNALRSFSLVVFSFSMVFLFSMSGVYHLLERGGEGRYVLLHLDHSAIWVLIAGTFTPIQIIMFRGWWRWGMLGLVWTLAITGLVLKIIFFSEIPEWLGLSFYLSLGWLGVANGLKLRSRFNSDGFRWLFIGGIAYSIGALFDFLRWPILIDGVVGPHEIFHVFIILGALSHWIFVYNWASHPIKDLMTFDITILPENKFVAESVGDFVRLETNCLDALRQEIRKVVRLKYHKNITPKIRLRFNREEHIH